MGIKKIKRGFGVNNQGGVYIEAQKNIGFNVQPQMTVNEP